MFKQNGIDCRPSELPKSDIYLHNISLINSGVVALLDHPTLHHQLSSLERRVARSGRDDVCNAACGAIWIASTAKLKPLSAYLSAPQILNASETQWVGGEVWP
jgi:hypothetical protein